MEPAVLDRFAVAFFDSVARREEDVVGFLLRPWEVDGEVLVYAATHRGSWGGAVVNGVDVWRCDRVRGVRELWARDAEKELGVGGIIPGPVVRQIPLRAAVYALALEEGDRVDCAWKSRRSGWTWTTGQLREIPDARS